MRSAKQHAASMRNIKKAQAARRKGGKKRSPKRKSVSYQQGWAHRQRAVSEIDQGISRLKTAKKQLKFVRKKNR